MELSIDDSRSIYAYIKKCMPTYVEFNPATIVDFYSDIATKHEFVSLEEDEPEVIRGMYNHQVLINRILGPRTGILSQLIFYQMGLGKSFIYLSLIDTWRKANPSMNRPLILVRNMKLVSTIKSEIQKFTKIILKSDDFPDDASAKYINSVIRSKYNVQTYQRFASYLASVSESEYKTCVNDHSNTIIVLDEVQHLKNMEHIPVYDIIYKFIKSVTNTRIYEFSGTPMIDSAHEFENIINIVIPNPIKLTFDDHNILLNEGELKKNLAGYISYLKFKPADLSLVTAGKYNFENTGYYTDLVNMSKFQSYHFYRALAADGVKDGLHVEYNLPHTIEQYTRASDMKCWIKSDRVDRLKASIDMLTGWLKAHTNSNVSLTVHTGAQPIERRFDILWFVDEVPRSLSDIEKNIVVEGVYKFIVFTNIDGEFITDIQFDPSIGRVVKPIGTFRFFMYETDMDRFIRSMEADLDVAESVDTPISSEYSDVSSQGTAYLNANQASIFVYPDGQYGRNGERKYLKLTYNARDVDEWIDISRRYPCDIYTKILTNVKNNNRVVAQASRTDANIVFLIKVLNSLKYKKALDVRDAVHNPDSNFYMMSTFNSKTNVSEYSNMWQRIIATHNIKVIFITCSRTDFIDIRETTNLSRFTVFNDLERYASCAPRNEFDEYFSIATIDGLLQKVLNLSTKYHTILNNIIFSSSRVEGGGIPIMRWTPKNKVYIYSELIHGSGVIVLMRLLERLGYTNVVDELHKMDDASNPISLMKPRPRYAFISSAISDAMMSTIIEMYNSSKNVSGSYIQIFMGTETVSEGITLRDTPVMFSVTRTWNIASSDQAERRIYRLNAFNALKSKRMISNVEVDMKRLVAIPLGIHSPSKNEDPQIIDSWLTSAYDTSKSLDMYICHSAIDKDKRIKAVEYMCKTISIDCSCNYTRNELDSKYDDSRECEYRKCAYVCDLIPSTDRQIDTSTYYSFYAYTERQEIKEHIIAMFSKKTYYTYDEFIIDDIIRGYMVTDDRMVFSVLHDIINNKVPILSPLGFKQVLYYHRGIFYISNIDIPNNFLNYTYSDNPIKTEFPKIRRSMDDLYNDIIERTTPNKLDDELLKQHVEMDNMEGIETLISSPRFDTPTALSLVQYAVLMPGETAVSKFVREKYARYIQNIHGIHLVRLHSDYHIYHNGVWSDIRDLYESSDEARLPLVSLLTDYFINKLKISEQYILNQHVPLSHEITCLYGTFKYDGLDKFTFNVYAGKTDMKTKLQKNILDYLTRKKKKDIIPSGMNVASLSKSAKEFIRSICHLSEDENFKSGCIACLESNGLTLL